MLRIPIWRHLSLRTERAYLGWMRQYILFHGRRHPAEMEEVEINAFVPCVKGRVGRTG